MTQRGDGQPDLLGDIADDSLTILRLNIFIVAVYASVIALSLRAGQDMVSILESNYTFWGMFCWSGTFAVTFYLYFAARTSTFVQIGDEDLTRLNHSVKTIRTLLTSSVMGTFLTVICFSFGYYDGLSEAPVTLQSLVSILGGGVTVVFLAGVYTLLGFIGIFTILQKWGEFTDWLQDSAKEDIQQVALSQIDELRERRDDEMD